jgi:L-ascorbate metabolism protein UlaG (beta-lactamase superfamily)
LPQWRHNFWFDSASVQSKDLEAGGVALTTTLDWYGCATFRLQTQGLTVFLDAYIDRAPNAAGPGLTTDDIDACDWILIGHSHFDHLWGAERIIARTGARLIGSYETVRLLEQAGVPLDRLICVGGGERIDLGHGVFVSVYPSLHSCLWTGSHAAGAGDVCLGDLGVTWQQREVRMQELVARLSTSLDDSAIGHLMKAAPGHSDRGDGGALLYLVETPEGSVLFQDTSGHWGSIMGTLSPDVAILAAAGRANVDGEPIQGSLARFVVDEAKVLGAQRVILGHLDNWLPGFASAPDLEPIRTAFKEHAPEIELLEPGYLASTPIFDGLPR